MAEESSASEERVVCPGDDMPVLEAIAEPPPSIPEPEIPAAHQPLPVATGSSMYRQTVIQPPQSSPTLIPMSRTSVIKSPPITPERTLVNVNQLAVKQEIYCVCRQPYDKSRLLSCKSVVSN